MNYQFSFSSYFLKEAKRLSKKYKSFPEDLQKLKDDLLQNPYQGDDLGNGIRKIRMSITSKGKGKSGGARVITMNVLISQDDALIEMLLIYDKSDAPNFKDNVLKEIIKEMGIMVKK